MPTRIYFTGAADPLAVKDDIEEANGLLYKEGGNRVRVEVVNGATAYVNPDAVAYLVSYTPQRSAP